MSSVAPESEDSRKLPDLGDLRLSQESPPHVDKSTLLVLPGEIIDHIAKCLLDDGLYGSCANLNVCNREIHSETIGTLYRTVRIETQCDMDQLDKAEDIQRLLKISGSAHIRFLVITCGEPRRTLQRDPHADFVASFAESSVLANIRAIVIRHEKLGIYGFRENDRNVDHIFLRPAYDALQGADHIELLAAIDFGFPISLIEVYPSLIVQARDEEEFQPHRIIPYERRDEPYTAIQRCEIAYDRTSVQVEENPDAIADAFATALALVAYTRDLWEELTNKDGRWTPLDLAWNKRSDDLEEFEYENFRVSATRNESMIKCLEVFAKCLAMNPRFAVMPIDLSYPHRKWMDNLVEARSTAQLVYQPLRKVYRDACKCVPHHAEPIRPFGRAGDTMLVLSPVVAGERVLRAEVMLDDAFYRPGEEASVKDARVRGRGFMPFDLDE